MLETANRSLEAFLDRNLRFLFGIAIGYMLAGIPNAFERYQQFFAEMSVGRVLVGSLILAVVCSLIWKATRDAIKSDSVQDK